MLKFKKVAMLPINNNPSEKEPEQHEQKIILNTLICLQSQHLLFISTKTRHLRISNDTKGYINTNYKYTIMNCNLKTIRNCYNTYTHVLPVFKVSTTFSSCANIRSRGDKLSTGMAYQLCIYVLWISDTNKEILSLVLYCHQPITTNPLPLKACQTETQTSISEHGCEENTE